MTRLGEANARDAREEFDCSHQGRYRQADGQAWLAIAIVSATIMKGFTSGADDAVRIVLEPLTILLTRAFVGTEQGQAAAAVMADAIFDRLHWYSNAILRDSHLVRMSCDSGVSPIGQAGNRKVSAQRISILSAHARTASRGGRKSTRARWLSSLPPAVSRGSRPSARRHEHERCHPPMSCRRVPAWPC